MWWSSSDDIPLERLVVLGGFNFVERKLVVCVGRGECL